MLLVDECCGWVLLVGGCMLLVGGCMLLVGGCMLLVGVGKGGLLVSGWFMDENTAGGIITRLRKPL